MCLSHRVEHAFAALKGRFQSLQDLRQNINSADDLQAAVHWIQYCLILHNMIIRFEEHRGHIGSSGSVTLLRTRIEYANKGNLQHQ